jgi:hypothetical protein
MKKLTVIAALALVVSAHMARAEGGSEHARNQAFSGCIITQFAAGEGQHSVVVGALSRETVDRILAGTMGVNFWVKDARIVARNAFIPRGESSVMESLTGEPVQAADLDNSVFISFQPASYAANTLSVSLLRAPFDGRFPTTLVGMKKGRGSLVNTEENIGIFCN